MTWSLSSSLARKVDNWLVNERELARAVQARISYVTREKNPARARDPPLIYAFRFCRAQQWQGDVSEYILPLSTSLSVFRALCGRASLPALAIYPVSLSPVSSLLPHPLPGFHLALRHSYFCPATSSSSGRFLAAAMRPCNAAGTAVGTPYPANAAAVAPLQLQQQRRRRQRPTHTLAQR